MKPICSKCNQQGILIESIDSYACIRCDTWLEETCKILKDCEFCSKRPEKPSEAK